MNGSSRAPLPELDRVLPAGVLNEFCGATTNRKASGNSRRCVHEPIREHSCRSSQQRNADAARVEGLQHDQGDDNCAPND